MKRLALVISLLALLGGLHAAAAPTPRVDLPVFFLDAVPAETAAAAFAEPYGGLLAAEFAAVVRASADPACLKEKGFDKDIEARARNLLVRKATRMVEFMAGTADHRAFEERFILLKGVGALDEFAMLRRDPDVQRYLALWRPARLAYVADYLIENASRSALIMRIPLKRPFSPLETGNETILRADPTDAVHDRVDEFVTFSRSSALARYLDLEKAAQRAFNDSIDNQVWLNSGPGQLVPDLPEELAALCIQKP